MTHQTVSLGKHCPAVFLSWILLGSSAVKMNYNRPRSRYQYFNTPPRLSDFFYPSVAKRDTTKTTPNVDVCPEDFGAMLKY